MAQAAGEVADKAVGKLHQFLGNAGIVHYRTSGNEERDRHQRLRLTACEQLLSDNGRLNIRV